MNPKENLDANEIRHLAFVFSKFYAIKRLVFASSI